MQQIDGSIHFIYYISFTEASTYMFFEDQKFHSKRIAIKVIILNNFKKMDKTENKLRKYLCFGRSFLSMIIYNIIWVHSQILILHGVEEI